MHKIAEEHTGNLETFLIILLDRSILNGLLEELDYGVDQTLLLVRHL